MIIFLRNPQKNALLTNKAPFSQRLNMRIAFSLAIFPKISSLIFPLPRQRFKKSAVLQLAPTRMLQQSVPKKMRSEIHARRKARIPRPAGTY